MSMKNTPSAISYPTTHEENSNWEAMPLNAISKDYKFEDDVLGKTFRFMVQVVGDEGKLQLVDWIEFSRSADLSSPLRWGRGVQIEGWVFDIDAPLLLEGRERYTYLIPAPLPPKAVFRDPSTVPKVEREFVKFLSDFDDVPLDIFSKRHCGAIYTFDGTIFIVVERVEGVSKRIGILSIPNAAVCAKWEDGGIRDGIVHNRRVSHLLTSFKPRWDTVLLE
ncbi:hypothetical protein B0T17DRAFT_219092 [Bombardia bombarda]|uniref:Uncharacterized protein n=1 Tax=Bombardia bombarda TaxID=252184 RepID=A0AA39XAI0_9PEZI|nr:hypothetical protein B0T17DRAFT_219092 [Bombardia bombarda]